MRAYVLSTSQNWQRVWFSQGYTNVVCWHDGEKHQLLRFKNEFAARTYADSINIGHSINLKGEHHA